jgi:hypothetical protein
VGHVESMETKNAYKILVGKTRRKIPPGRLGRRREHNVKMNLKGIGFESVALIQLAQATVQRRTLMNAAMKPSNHHQLSDYQLLRGASTHIISS